jgi:hypothetical protein
MSSRTSLDFYTTQGWTVSGYNYPTTTQLYTIFAESTPIATIRLLPESAGGGVLLPNNRLLDTYDAPAIVDHAILMVDGYYTPAIIFSRIYGVILSDAPSLSAPPPNLGTPSPLQVTSLRSLTSGGRSSSNTFQTSTSTSRILSTDIASATDDVSADDPNLLEEPNSGDSEASRLSAGSIAGISIGVILVVSIVVGAWIILRRRRKSRSDTNDGSNNTSSKRESDKMVVDQDEVSHGSSAQQLNYQDASGMEYMQELDPSHSNTFMIHAHELKADATPGELSRHQSGSHSHFSPTDNDQDHEIEPTADSILPAPSPHVEAQRIRELEWLEMEEARLRQRREQLIRQSGEHQLRSEDS